MSGRAGAGDGESARPAAVIGANGFIGSAVVSRLHAGGVPVWSFTRGVPFVSSSGRLDPAVEASRTVFWLAASVNPAVAEERPDLVEADQAAFESLLAGLEAIDDPARVVLLSSGGTVYDPDAEPPYREDGPLRPVTAYGRAKVRLEEALAAARLPAGRGVVVRVANAYGPGQPVGRGQGVIAHWLRAAAAGEPLVLLGDPATVRDYVYIGDIADALARIHQVASVPPVLNVGSGLPLSLGDLASIIVGVVADPAIEIQVRPARRFDLSRTWLDVGLAEAALGWRAGTSMADGVRAAWRQVTDERDGAAGSSPASRLVPAPPSSPPR